MSKLQDSQNLCLPLHTADGAYLQTESHTGSRQEYTQETPQDSYQRNHRGRKTLETASHLQLLLRELRSSCPVLLGTPSQKCPSPPTPPTHMNPTSSCTLFPSHYHFPPPHLVPNSQHREQLRPHLPQSQA